MYATLQSTSAVLHSGNDVTLAGDFGNKVCTSPTTECYAIDYVLCDGHYTADVTLLPSAQIPQM